MTKLQVGCGSQRNVLFSESWRIRRQEYLFPCPQSYPHILDSLFFLLPIPRKSQIGTHSGLFTFLASYFFLFFPNSFSLHRPLLVPLATFYLHSFFFFLNHSAANFLLPYHGLKRKSLCFWVFHDLIYSIKKVIHILFCYIILSWMSEFEYYLSFSLHAFYNNSNFIDISVPYGI